MSQVRPGPALSTGHTVKGEPMFFRATGEYAYHNGGPITREFLRALDTPLDKILFDSRVHMLMKDWYPCIPGWHHDDVARTRADGQPDYDNAPYRPRFAMALVGDSVCRTEFALGEACFTKIPEGQMLYETWHQEVENLIDAGELTSWLAPMHQVIYFDDRSWHQGTQATGRGWRWFGRATFDSMLKPENEIRQQVQVYLANPMGGW